MVLGVLNNRVCDFREPGTVLDQFLHLRRAKELDTIGRRAAEGL